MQPLTYASLAVVFLSCLTIAWTGALVEVIGGGLLGSISGAMVGALFGAGNLIAAFLGWIVLGILVSILIKVAFLELALPIFIIVMSSGVGTVIAGLIVNDLGYFYLHHSRTKLKFGVTQGAGVGSAIAGVLGTGYWAVISATILNASQKLIKNFVNQGFGMHSAILLLLLTALSGMSVGIMFQMTGFYNLSAIYFVALVDLTVNFDNFLFI